MSVLHNGRVFKEPNVVRLPEECEKRHKEAGIYELLLRNHGDYKEVSRILDSKIEETNQLINDLTTNVKTMDGDVFEKKLNKLKSDNLETMLLCEEFRKISERKSKDVSSDMKRSDEYINNDDKKFLYNKPPIPKFQKSLTSSNNHHIPCFDYHINERSNYCKRSWNENEENFDEEEEDIKKREQNYKREAAFDRLTRPKSNLTNYYENNIIQDLHDPDALVAKWRHKVTVPQPFSMTIRDEVKQKHLDYLSNDNNLRKSRTLLEFEMERSEKEQKEFEETKKQFRANPVPGHVYIPLYSSMQEEANQRRQLFKEYNKELLKSIEKPFSFYKRDLEKKKNKSEMSSEGVLKQGVKVGSNKVPLKSYHGERQSTIFRAKPIPKYTVESSAIEKLKEDDLYRQIKIEMRSKKLLEESKLPGNMEERQREQDERRKRNSRKDFNYSLRQRSHSADSSRAKKYVPDFSKIHQRWEEEVRMSYKEPYVTQTKPFNLLTEKRPITRYSADNQQSNQENMNTPQKVDEWNKSILAALEMVKPSTNKSTMLRETATKSKILNKEMKQQHKEIEKLSKKKREVEVASMIRKSLELDALPKNKDKQRQKVKQLRIENERKKEDYAQNLEEMHERVKQRQLLLEKVPKRATSVKNMNKYEETHSSIHKNGKFGEYDERNNFGDAGSYRNSTDASSTIVSAHSPRYDDESFHSQ